MQYLNQGTTRKINPPTREELYTSVKDRPEASIIVHSYQELYRTCHNHTKAAKTVQIWQEVSRTWQNH